MWMCWEAASGCRGHGGLLRGLWVGRVAPGPAWAPTALLGLCGGLRRSETLLPLRTPGSCRQESARGGRAWGHVQCEMSHHHFSPQLEAGRWQGLVSPRVTELPRSCRSSKVKAWGGGSRVQDEHRRVEPQPCRGSACSLRF